MLGLIPERSTTDLSRTIRAIVEGSYRSTGSNAAISIAVYDSDGLPRGRTKSYVPSGAAIAMTASGADPLFPAPIPVNPARIGPWLFEMLTVPSTCPKLPGATDWALLLADVLSLERSDWISTFCTVYSNPPEANCTSVEATSKIPLKTLLAIGPTAAVPFKPPSPSAFR